jgi:hypothetical protein
VGPLPYPNPGRGRVTVNGLVTQPQTGGAGIGPTSITTHGFISGGGGAWADGRTTAAVNRRLHAKTTQVERIRSTGLDTGNGVLDWEALHEACRGDPRVIRGSLGCHRWTADAFATRRSEPQTRWENTRRCPTGFPELRHTPIAPFGAPMVAWPRAGAMWLPCGAPTIKAALRLRPDPWRCGPCSPRYSVVCVFGREMVVRMAARHLLSRRLASVASSRTRPMARRTSCRAGPSSAS